MLYAKPSIYKGGPTIAKALEDLDVDVVQIAKAAQVHPFHMEEILAGRMPMPDPAVASYETLATFLSFELEGELDGELDGCAPMTADDLRALAMGDKEAWRTASGSVYKRSKGDR